MTCCLHVIHATVGGVPASGTDPTSSCRAPVTWENHLTSLQSKAFCSLFACLVHSGVRCGGHSLVGRTARWAGGGVGQGRLRSPKAPSRLPALEHQVCPLTSGCLSLLISKMGLQVLMGCSGAGPRTNSTRSQKPSPRSCLQPQTPSPALFLHSYNPVRGSSLQSSCGGYQQGPWAVT